MVNLHIGGAVSVFLICVSLLACDHWFNRGGSNNLRLSNTLDSYTAPPGEFVSVPSRLFFFTEKPHTNRREAGPDLRQSWGEEEASWADNFQSEKLAPDGNFFSSGLQKN
jgi:hypothetical protein